MKYRIRNVVVIGSGTMGAAIAAHLANAGVKVMLLDIVPSELTIQEKQNGCSLEDRVVRNRITREGLDRVIASRPASFFTRDHSNLISIGNLEDDFFHIEYADWIIEAIIENLEIKRNLIKRIDNKRREESIVSTNTSGIPVGSIVEGFSESLREHFLGTHFFNPPRYLKLLEIIPTRDTLPAVVKYIEYFAELRLGKGVVLAKDTPNFIANRLFAGSAAFLMDFVLENKFSVPEVDAITGPPIGNPKSATFRLFDLIGLDVWQHVGRNLAPALKHDQHALKYLNSERVKKLIDTMVSNGWFGNKTKQGFYKQVTDQTGNKEFWHLNLETLEYEAPVKSRFESIGKVKDEENLGKRLEVLLIADDRAGELVRGLIFQSLTYASEMIPEIADTPQPIDDAMRWGFNREAGPFETWDMLGVEAISYRMKEYGFSPAAWVEEMLAVGVNSFYQYKNGVKTGVYNPSIKKYSDIKRPTSIILLKEKKASNKLIDKNPGASLIDIGDGVACVEFHTKMNTLDVDIFNMVQEGLNRVDTDFEGLVVGNEAENFSAGANLFLVVMLAKNKDWEQLDTVVKNMQELLMRIRYFHKPVVAAPAGLALGGGAEIIMSASRVVAHAELYTGLVEIGAGVIPAGSGTKEMLRRILNPPMRINDVVALPFIQRIFEQIGLAKVATSADEARQFGILTSGDQIVMNRDLLLSEAKKEVLHLANAGYRPPLPEKIYAAGRDVLSAMKVGVWMMREGGYITEHELLIANKLANVLTGGEISKPTWVEEQYILDLEREAFLSLCGEEKTQQRMWNLLQTGKPLRN